MIYAISLAMDGMQNSIHCKFVKTFPSRPYTTKQYLFKNKAFLALVSLKPMSVSCLRMFWNKKMHIL